MFNRSRSLIVSFTTPHNTYHKACRQTDTHRKVYRQIDTIRFADKLTLTVRFADADFTAVVVSLVIHSMFTQVAFGRWAHC